MTAKNFKSVLFGDETNLITKELEYFLNKLAFFCNKYCNKSKEVRPDILSISYQNATAC